MPGHARSSFHLAKRVDGQDKPGHDETYTMATGFVRDQRARCYFV